MHYIALILKLESRVARRSM